MVDETLQGQVQSVERGLITYLHEGLIVDRYTKVRGLIEEEQYVIMCSGLGLGGNVCRDDVRLASTVEIRCQVGDNGVHNYRWKTGFVPVGINH